MRQTKWDSDKFGLGQNGSDKMGLGRDGMDRIRFGQSGTGQTGRTKWDGQSGMDQMDLNRAGLYRVSPSPPNPRRNYCHFAPPLLQRFQWRPRGRGDKEDDQRDEEDKKQRKLKEVRIKYENQR